MLLSKQICSKHFYKYKKKFKWSIGRLYSSLVGERTESITQKLNVLFFGNDNFSLETLKRLTSEKKQSSIINNIGVVTSQKSKIKSIENFANSNQLKCFYWPIRPEDCAGYDLGVVTSFGHLIPENIITAFPHGMVNVHGSLLPRWRGAAPTIYALMHGDKTTGVTIMNIRPKHFDIGEIIAQREVAIGPHTLLPELNSTLAVAGADLLVECLRNFPCKSTPQSNDGITYAPRVQSSLAEINWQMTAKQIYNLYRALYTFQPITAKWHSHKIKLIKMSLDLENDSVVSLVLPGHIAFRKDGPHLQVMCGDGKFIIIEKLMIATKTMSASDFNNGFLKKVSKDYHFFS